MRALSSGDAGAVARFRIAAVAMMLAAVFVAVATQVDDARVASLLPAGGAQSLYFAQSAYWGALSGIMNMGAQAGGIVVASSTPIIAEPLGWTGSFLAAAALALVGGLVWLAVDPHRRVCARERDAAVDAHSVRNCDQQNRRREIMTQPRKMMARTTATTLVAMLVLQDANAQTSPASAQESASTAATTPPRPFPPTTSPLRRTRNESFRPRERNLLYVSVPGSLEEPGYRNGRPGVIVLDKANDYLFVKRIPTWDYPASVSPEQVAGFAASAVHNLMYVSARGRIGAWDLATDKKVWETELDGNCCERPQLTADGKFLVVGSDLRDYWFVLEPRTGKLIRKLEAPMSPGAHNLNLSPDGKLAFMSPNNPVLTISDIATGKIVKEITFEDHVRVFVLNRDGTKIYSNLNNLDGFVIADVATGKVTHRLENKGDWKEKWTATPRPRIPHACPSHGIALVNNETEIWVADGINDLIHVYDNTKETPVEVATIKPTHGVYWMTVGLDGKLIYASSGDIIDAKTRKIVGTMRDETGKQIYSEKLLEMTFRDGKIQRVVNQFGNGYGDQNNLGQTNATGGTSGQ